jgi:rhamnogalacturonyl hydrolase YesR
MYTVYSRATGLITEVLDGDDFRYVLTRDESRDQSFFHPGIAAGFLTRLYKATGQPEWLSLAREYMRFADHVGDYHFSLLRAGKLGWAASIMYTVTGEQQYRNMAIRVGDNLIKTQTDEGFWETELGNGVPGNDATAELIVWLDEVYQAVGEG